MFGASNAVWKPLLILVALISVAPLCAQPTAPTGLSLTIRFVDAASGKPIRSVWVWVSTWNTDESPVPADKLISRSGFKKTNKHGSAEFAIPEPVPRYIGVNHSPVQLRGCSVTVFSLHDALSAGIVASYNPHKTKPCGQLRAKASAKPGAIVIYDRRLTLWDRMRREIP